MPLIEDSYPGRKDGSYTRIFGSAEIGSLISAIHSTSIAAGNDLETLISYYANLIDDSLIDAFHNHSLPPGKYLITKKVIKNDTTLKFEQEPDCIMVLTKDNECKIVEIKLGDNFDTKKSKGEVTSMRKYAQKANMVLKYKVSYAVCMWFAKDKESVVNGFKREITAKEALTGREFCKLLDIDYDVINSKLDAYQKQNRDFLFSKVAEIQSILSK